MVRTRMVHSLACVLTARWDRRAVQHARLKVNWETKRATGQALDYYGHEGRELVELAGIRCNGRSAGLCAMLEMRKQLTQAIAIEEDMFREGVFYHELCMVVLRRTGRCIRSHTCPSTFTCSG